MANPSNPTQIKKTQLKTSRLCEHDTKVLLDYNIPAQIKEIKKLADAVNKALADRDLAFATNLCLEELITNTIVHGLKGTTDRFIQVRLSLSKQWLEILIKDDAPPFDPFIQAPKPNLEADMDKRPIGGLGIHLVKTLMDDADAYYDGTGNWYVLYKALDRLDSNPGRGKAN